MNKFTRRSLIAATVASPLVNAQAQTPAATSAEDWAKAAREANKANAEALAKIALPMATEPAFTFKA